MRVDLVIGLVKSNTSSGDLEKEYKVWQWASKGVIPGSGLCFWWNPEHKVIVDYCFITVSVVALDSLIIITSFPDLGDAVSKLYDSLDTV